MMMAEPHPNDEAELRARALGALLDRRGPLAMLSRLVCKRGWPKTVNWDACRLSLDQMTVRDCHALFSDRHEREEPQREPNLFLAGEYRGEVKILDGTNRLNRWVRTGDLDRVVDVIFIQFDEALTEPA